MLKKLITAIITSFVFTSIVAPFIDSTIIKQSEPMYVFIIFVAFTTVYIKKLWLRLPLHFVSLLIMARFYADETSATFITWSIDFVRSTLKLLVGFISREVTLMTYQAGVFLIGLLVAILMNYVIRKNRWGLTYIAIVGYYFVLIAFNKSIITTPLIQLTVSSFVWGLWILYQDKLKHVWKGATVSLVILGLLATTSYYHYQALDIVYRPLVLQTAPLRYALSSRGFYSFFNLRRITGIGSTSGFSEDDSILGGPLYLNYDPVFEVTQDKPTYWKLDSKYFYTGRGWQDMRNSVVGREYQTPLEYEETSEYQDKALSATITKSYKTLPFIPLPYGKVTVDFGTANYRGEFESYDIYQGRLSGSRYMYDPSAVSLTDLSYTRYEKDLNVSTLREEPIPTDQNIFSYRESTQLPNTVTQRTRELARNLVQGAQNKYDAVIAIRDYLTKGNGFVYNTENAPFPPDNQDFVDFFLFDSKLGYCEHYSTAMVVMLRTLGIQTRWVKGYAQGQLSDAINNTYTIRNADAHAWVEVYFEDYGWVPFEATPSFSMNFVSDSNETPDPTTPTNPTTPNNPTNPVTPPNPTRPTNPVTPLNPVQDNNSNITAELILGLIAIMAVIAVSVWCLYRYVAWLIYRLVFRSNKKSFMKQYRRLLRFVTWQHERPHGMGLEDYASSLETTYQDSFVALTDKYQYYYYGENTDSVCTQDDIQHIQTVLKGLKPKKFFRHIHLRG